MEMPQDILDRVKALDLALDRFQWMFREEGADFVRGFIECLEDAEALFREWSPKLREFAESCRASNPSPSADSLSARNRAKLPIYQSMIETAERLPGLRCNTIIICSLPAMAIPIARRLWPGEDSRCVFLTREELDHWHEIYEHPDASFWWFMYYHWEIQDPPRSPGIWGNAHPLVVPEGCEPWLVCSGLNWGSLAGGGREDLWAWDGTTARFVNNYCDWQA